MQNSDKNKAEKLPSKQPQNNRGVQNKDDAFPSDAKKDIAKEQSNMRSEGGKN
ncbi:MAG: hypothetical protein KJ017_02020 [Alphaproteobacteria bacterium]|nr:hypothetical protein [Alphaproteobacteria bacterium]